MQRPLRRLTSLLAATTTLWLAGTGHAQIRLEEDARAHVEWPDRGPEGLRARDFLAGDLDGDGADDLVVIGHSDVDVMINAGNGTLAHRATVFVAQGRLATGTLFDADGDGDLDLLALAGDPLGYSSGGIPGVAFNDGAGNLARNFAKTVPNMQLQGLLVLAEDLDGDGDLDLTMIQNRGFQTVPDTIVVWENDGSGSFVDATAARAPSVGTCEAALAGDLDGDGHQDLLLSIGAPTGPMLLMYDGTAYVDRSSLLPGYPLALGDVDGDGDTDLVMSTGFELNDGTGANWTNVPHGALLAGNEVGFVGDLDL
ncbi:MAG: VCBS repeat-containing protein, partial [Planctomycetes bacterium]|nr:VCBS repeat-containing protein [Planctomycetota bacterium]